MRTRSKLFLVAIAATALLGLAVGTASANRIEYTNAERGFRLAWNELHFNAAGNIVTCRVTLEGSFTARTTVKRAGTQIANVTRAALSTPCTGGSATVLGATLPWATTYNSFTGTLPGIRTITFDLIRASLQIQVPGIETCLLVTEVNEPTRGIGVLNASGELTTLEADANARIGTRGGFLCAFAGKGAFSGSANATVLGGTAHVVFKLI